MEFDGLIIVGQFRSVGFYWSTGSPKNNIQKTLVGYLTVYKFHLKVIYHVTRSNIVQMKLFSKNQI
jgi:hypothetical protein